MSQLSLLGTPFQLSGVMAAIRAAMRNAAGAEESEGRKMLVDRLNDLAAQSGIRLTSGNSSAISKATLDKWLSPSDLSHPPSILALLVFCSATDCAEPLRVAARALGFDLMTREDRMLRDYAQAILDEKAARQRKNKLEKEL